MNQNGTEMINKPSAASGLSAAAGSVSLAVALAKLQEAIKRKNWSDADYYSAAADVAATKINAEMQLAQENMESMDRGMRSDGGVPIEVAQAAFDCGMRHLKRGLKFLSLNK